MEREAMSRIIHRTCLAATSLAIVALFSSVASGKEKVKDKSKPASASLDDYLKRAQSTTLDQPTTIGSLWVPNGLLAGASSDYKARMAGDLIMVLEGLPVAGLRAGRGGYPPWWSAPQKPEV